MYVLTDDKSYGVVTATKSYAIAFQLMQGFMNVRMLVLPDDEMMLIPYYHITKHFSLSPNNEFKSMTNPSPELIELKELVYLRHLGFINWAYIINRKRFPLSIPFDIVAQVEKALEEENKAFFAEYASIAGMNPTEVYEKFRLEIATRNKRLFFSHALAQKYANQINQANDHDTVTKIIAEMEKAFHAVRN